MKKRARAHIGLAPAAAHRLRIVAVVNFQCNKGWVGGLWVVMSIWDMHTALLRVWTTIRTRDFVNTRNAPTAIISVRNLVIHEVAHAPTTPAIRTCAILWCGILARSRAYSRFPRQPFGSPSTRLLMAHVSVVVRLRWARARKKKRALFKSVRSMGMQIASYIKCFLNGST